MGGCLCWRGDCRARRQPVFDRRASRAIRLSRSVEAGAATSTHQQGKPERDAALVLCGRYAEQRSGSALLPRRGSGAGTGVGHGRDFATGLRITSPASCRNPKQSKPSWCRPDHCNPGRHRSDQLKSVWFKSGDSHSGHCEHGCAHEPGAFGSRGPDDIASSGCARNDRVDRSFGLGCETNASSGNGAGGHDSARGHG